MFWKFVLPQNSHVEIQILKGDGVRGGALREVFKSLSVEP